ncbi:MAG: tetratricopeptide repeat protein [Thermodesulfobacteriota bacterium]
MPAKILRRVLPVSLLAALLFAGACSGPSYDENMQKGKELLSGEGEQDVTDAIESFSAAVKQRPDSYQAFYYRGMAESRLFDCAKALPDFSRAIELYPGFADAYYRRALCYILVDQTGSSRAVSDLKTTLALDPDHQGAAWHLDFIARQGRAN